MGSLRDRKILTVFFFRLMRENLSLLIQIGSIRGPVVLTASRKRNLRDHKLV